MSLEDQNTRDSDIQVLLTNDDGIENVGLRALYDALTEIGDVTVVAPVDDQSGVGHRRSNEVSVHEHELGYAVEGTPSDCVIVGCRGFDFEPDVVVSGCNIGPNIGEHILPQSGTVGGAAQAAHLGVPGIAVSLYSPENRYSELERDDYENAEWVTRDLVMNTVGGWTDIFDKADYLNVNVPSASVDDPSIRVTKPSSKYDMEVKHGEEATRIDDLLWERFKSGNATDSEGTDRGALIDNEVSVSPLKTSHAVVEDEIRGALKGNEIQKFD